MMPASLTPPWLLAEKLKAYENKYENLVHGGKKLKEKLKAYEKLVTTSHRHIVTLAKLRFGPVPHSSTAILRHAARADSKGCGAARASPIAG